MAIPLKLETPAHNGAFIALVFSIFGWVLITAGIVAWGAAVRIHVLVAVSGVPLVAIATRRYRQHWPTVPSEQRWPEGSKLFDAAWCVLLLVTGYILGQLVLAGWMLPLSIFTIALTFVPWSRVPVCRRHFLPSVILVGGAAAYPIFVTPGPVDPISSLVAGWVLFATASFSLLLRR